MSINANVQKVNFAEALRLARTALKANEVTMLIGDPGVGKSALAALLAKLVKIELGTMIGSTLDSTDVGGIIYINPKSVTVDRLPLQVIREACDRPMILFIDEVACMPFAVQAAILRLVFERVAGDRKLHPETRIFMATNPEEQAPAGVPISAPLVGRVLLAQLVPDPEEVYAHFTNLAAESGDEKLAEEFMAFVDTCQVAPSLLQIKIPDEAVGGNVPWGSPRAWERAIRLRAIAGPDALTVTSASVGRTQALAYEAIMDIRQSLPSVDSIIENPMEAKIPDDPKHHIGAASLVPAVHMKNPWAAWIYCDRLSPEMRTTCANILIKLRVDAKIAAGLPHAERGRQTRAKVLGTMPTARGVASAN
jgi:energy-coupling factor transporter ATP-binding protein EcfA2